MKLNNPLLIACLLLSLTTFNALASLTIGTSAGQSVVYSSISDITWTGDANLLGALESTLGYNNLINSIIAASPVVNGYHSFPMPITPWHFSPGGSGTWYGAKAFVNYLNTIRYAGSDRWDLPSADSISIEGYNNNSTQLGQLFYDELGGIAGNPIPNTDHFSNEQTYAYWSNTLILTSSGIRAWALGSLNGYQQDLDAYNRFHVWVVSPGNLINAVPIPGAIWLFGAGSLGLLGVVRKK